MPLWGYKVGPGLRRAQMTGYRTWFSNYDYDIVILFYYITALVRQLCVCPAKCKPFNQVGGPVANRLIALVTVPLREANRVATLARPTAGIF